MGDYNVDFNYNLPKMEILSRQFNFIPIVPILCDQWSIDSTNRVSSFRDGTNNINVKIKYDPTELPP